MKVSIAAKSFPNHTGLAKASFEGPAVMTLCPLYQINDGWFDPIAAMYSKFESYALRAEKMFDALILLGGSDLVTEMLNIGQVISPDLGIRKGYGYVHGLTNSFSIYEGKNSLSMVAVHFTDWVFQMVMDEGELGKLDFEHQEFDEFIQSLRDNMKDFK